MIPTKTTCRNWREGGSVAIGRSICVNNALMGIAALEVVEDF